MGEVVNKEKNISAQEAEDIFIDRLARILLKQVLDEQKKENSYQKLLE